MSEGPFGSRGNSADGASPHHWQIISIIAFLILAVAGVVVAYLLLDDNNAAADGANSGRDALVGVVEAFLNGDPATATKYVEPDELSALQDAGFDPLSELRALTAFLDGTYIDRAGVDPESAGLAIRAEPVGAEMERLYFTLASVPGSVDVSALFQSSLLTEWFPFEWDTAESSIPVVAVRRDGRWYISGWYSLAEYLRVLAGSQRSPDATQRPVEIGASTPTEALEVIVDEAMRLDARRLLGMLDPMEMAALYDYSGLFLNRMESVADAVLDARELDGWSWEAKQISAEVAVEGDLSVLTPTVYLSGQGELTSFELDLTPDSVEVARTGRDIWGEPTSFELKAQRNGDCTALINGYDSAERFCSLVAETWLNPNLVFHQVGSRWYLSPTRTAGRGSMLYLGLLGLGGMTDVLGSMTTIAFGLSPLTPAETGAEQTMSLDDLLSPALGTPDWSYVLESPDDVAYELWQWLPDDFGLNISSGVYAYYGNTEGGTAVVVLVAADDQAALMALNDLASLAGSEYVERFDRPVLSVAGPAGSQVLAGVDGQNLILVGSLGGDRSRIEELLALQLAG